MSPRLKLLIPLGLAVSVLLVSAFGYMVVEPSWTFGQALYEAAIIVTTTGLKEVEHLKAREVWTLFVMLFGIATIAIAFGIMTSTIVSGEMRRVLGRRTLQDRISQLSRHFIVCGYGRMGESVAKQLKQQGATVVVIDNNPDQTAKLEEEKCLYVLGDAAEEESLQRAGIMQARGLVAALPQDSANVFVVLTARGLREDLNISARAEQLSAQPKLLRAGANRVIGAMRVANIMLRPNVADFIEVTAQGVEFEVDEYKVTAESPLVNQTLQEADLRSKAGVMVVAIKRADGKTVFSPGAGEEILEGDTLIVIGQAGAAARLQ